MSEAALAAMDRNGTSVRFGPLQAARRHAWVIDILPSRGTGDRRFRNTRLFPATGEKRASTLLGDYAKLLSLSRLANPGMLHRVIEERGARTTSACNGFAHAELSDAEKGRYRGLRAGMRISVSEDDPGLIVKGKAALRQQQAGAQEGGARVDPARAAGMAAAAPPGPYRSRARRGTGRQHSHWLGRKRCGGTGG